MRIETGGFMGTPIRGGGPGKGGGGNNEKGAYLKRVNAVVTRHRLEHMNDDLTQEQLDAITPWSLLPIDRMIKLGFKNLKK